MGLKISDLQDLVRPLISVDEYESKINDDAIVVGFYVDDKDPAKDLSKFIESGGYNIVDTDVSPGTDDQGRYIVFVEFLRNESFPKELETILGAVEPLTGLDKWKFTYYGGHDRELDFSIDNIKQLVRLEPLPKDESTLESANMFHYSLLSNVEISGNIVRFTKGNLIKEYELVGCGSDSNLIFESLNLEDKPVSFSQNDLYESQALRQMLGSEWWDVNVIDGYYVLTSGTTDQTMILR